MKILFRLSQSIILHQKIDIDSLNDLYTTSASLLKFVDCFWFFIDVEEWSIWIYSQDRLFLSLECFLLLKSAEITVLLLLLVSRF
jgi:hypothetical protein